MAFQKVLHWKDHRREKNHQKIHWCRSELEKQWIIITVLQFLSFLACFPMQRERVQHSWLPGSLYFAHLKTLCHWVFNPWRWDCTYCHVTGLNAESLLTLIPSLKTWNVAMRGGLITPSNLTVKSQTKDITHVLGLSCTSQLCRITHFVNFFLFYFETTKASQPIVDLSFPSRRLLGVTFMEQEVIF